ncbi:unnamed protein product [Darwinula stevensoni]|uniref:Uncharacterized protein n=1 Tax=Darwinula stevensoni TaxID=69355 RepID=A0A7R9A215_9CRUS|nr:unnamed protein product [Darwinula stevensoni]CAG0887766.1 unnamed protein product [Darwinula stevensoni]
MSVKFNIINNNRVTELSDGIFGDVSFKNIFIHTAQNLIAVHVSALLSSDDSLVEATFSLCDLEDFPWHVLPQMVALTKLDLHGNAFAKLPVLRSSTLEHLDLSDNNITALESGWVLPNLRWLYMDENPVTEFPRGFFTGFENLKVFYCINCKLGPILHSRSLEFNSQALEFLFLNGNDISALEAGAISGFNGNTIISLDYNLITEVTEEVFRPILEVLSSGTGWLYLLGNPIQCVCSMAWLVLDQDLLPEVTGECESGASFQELDPYFFEEFCFEMNPPMPGDYSTWVFVRWSSSHSTPFARKDHCIVHDTLQYRNWNVDHFPACAHSHSPMPMRAVRPIARPLGSHAWRKATSKHLDVRERLELLDAAGCVRGDRVTNAVLETVWADRSSVRS